MSSDYKGKNIFGADIYQGSDGIYHSKEEADRTWRSDYKSSHDDQQPTYTPYGSGNTGPSQNTFSSPSEGTYYSSPWSDETKHRILGLVLTVAGSWVVVWALMTFHQGYNPPGVIYHLLSTIALIFVWPGKLLFGAMASKTIPSVGIGFYLLVPLLNFAWVGVIGKMLLKKAKLQRVFGRKHKKYQQLSWIKVALILLAVQLLVGLSAQL